MAVPDKKSLSEKELEDLVIVPALHRSGWQPRQIRRQDAYTIGRVIIRNIREKLWTRGLPKRPDFSPSTTACNKVWTTPTPTTAGLTCASCTPPTATAL